jgi:hypothetical protein
MMEIPAVIDWAALPGFVTTDTKLKYRVVINSVTIDCSSEHDVIELIQLMQKEYVCDAKRIAAAVERASRTLPDTADAVAKGSDVL